MRKDRPILGCPFNALTKGPPLAGEAKEAEEEEDIGGGNVEEGGLCVLLRPLLM